MLLLDQLVEKKIQQAEGDGTFANLPGRGRPVKLEDLTWVPETLRPAYILLKNSGYLPTEIQQYRNGLNPRALVIQLLSHHLKNPF